jgi:xanthine dehydrogenase accessory factor
MHFVVSRIALSVLCSNLVAIQARIRHKGYLFVNTLAQFLSRLDTARAVLVSVQATRGSVPRESGAWMAVFGDKVVNTIGGGRLELEAIDHARSLLAAAGPNPGDAPQRLLYRLGPGLGQCCGGEVQLQYECVSQADAPALCARLSAFDAPLALFGGGHVGRALVQVLSALTIPITWIDSRDEIFPERVPDLVHCEHSDPVQAAVPGLASGSRVLIMSFSHAEDLDIVAACLARQRAHGDLPYVGLIGSRTKWVAFRSRLAARGYTEAELAHITCPIGIPGIADKRPEAIAIAVAAQLLLLGNTP